MTHIYGKVIVLQKSERCCAIAIARRIVCNGRLFFEINQYLGKETIQLLKDIGFTNVQLRKDIFGNDVKFESIIFIENKNIMIDFEEHMKNKFENYRVKSPNSGKQLEWMKNIDFIFAKKLILVEYKVHY